MHNLKKEIQYECAFIIVITLLKLYRWTQKRSEQMLCAERGSERPAVIFHIKV